MHQVLVIGKTLLAREYHTLLLLAIVLHVAISVKQSRRHGILHHWLGGLAKSPPVPLFRETLLMKLPVYRPRNNKSDVNLIESQSHIKVN